jgi:crotonobetainyl-CoA:carnitine CoA-transferase CaiB-like acyl-CoA transferase
VTALDSSVKSELLAGLRAVIVGESAAVRYAGFALASMGADVTRAPEYQLEDDFEKAVALGTKVVSTAELGQLLFDVCVADADTEGIGLLAERGPVVSVKWPFAVDARALSAALSASSGASTAIGERGRAPLDMPGESACIAVGAVVAGTALSLAYGPPHPTLVELDAVSILVSFFEQNVSSYTVRGIEWTREGHRAAQSCGTFPYASYACKDGGRVAVIARSTQDWSEIARAVGADDLLAEYPDALAIIDDGHLDEVDRQTAEYFAKFTTDELTDIAERTGVLIAPMASIEAVLGYGEPLTSRGYWLVEGDQRIPGLPWAIHRRDDEAQSNREDS